MNGNPMNGKSASSWMVAVLAGSVAVVFVAPVVVGVVKAIFFPLVVVLVLVVVARLVWFFTGS